jgi:hypothetical protein
VVELAAPTARSADSRGIELEGMGDVRRDLVDPRLVGVDGEHLVAEPHQLATVLNPEADDHRWFMLSGADADISTAGRNATGARGRGRTRVSGPSRPANMVTTRHDRAGSARGRDPARPTVLNADTASNASWRKVPRAGHRAPSVATNTRATASRAIDSAR